MKKIIAMIMVIVICVACVACRSNSDVESTVHSTESTTAETTVNTNENTNPTDVIENNTNSENIAPTTNENNTDNPTNATEPSGSNNNNNNAQDNDAPNDKNNDSETKTEPTPNESNQNAENKPEDNQTEETTAQTEEPTESNENNNDVVEMENEVENNNVSANEFEQGVFNIINQHRRNNGLPALKFDYSLYTCAKVRASEAEYYFSHTRPNGQHYSSVFAEYGVTWDCVAGENVGRYFATPEEAMVEFMASAAHKKNILYADFTRVCIAVVESDLYPGYYVVEQLFMGAPGTA